MVGQSKRRRRKREVSMASIGGRKMKEEIEKKTIER